MRASQDGKGPESGGDGGVKFRNPLKSRQEAAIGRFSFDVKSHQRHCVRPLVII